MMPKLTDGDEDLFLEMEKEYNEIKEIRIGDWIRFKDGKMNRVTHIWDFRDEGLGLKVQSGGSEFGSFYFGHGYISYSGGLDPGVKGDTLELTDDVKYGQIWFFHNTFPMADNGVYRMMKFRVFKEI